MPTKKNQTSNLRANVTAKMFKATKEQQDSPKDAVALLKADHQEVTKLYEAFEKAKSAPQKKTLAGEICLALSVHMRIEEEILYPAAKKALKDKDGKELVPEARVEHASLKQLITEVETAPESEEFDARIKVMSEYTKHHVKEEETEMFPKLQATDLDLDDLGHTLQVRKLELLDEMATKASRLSKPPKPSSLFTPRSRTTRAGRGNSSRHPHARG
jgi:hypothetical protein